MPFSVESYYGILIRSKYPVVSPSRFSSFWGTLDLLKGKMNREHNILEITKNPNALDNF
jgi:hypothetical protein